jgi:excisionase family DNA binding protein
MLGEQENRLEVERIMLSDRIFTIEDVAEHWKVTTRAINELIASGQLRATKFAGQIRITEAALNEYIAQENGSVQPTNSVQSDVSVNLGSAADFAHTWPDGSKEQYTDTQEGTATYAGRNYHVRIGFTKRHSAGKERRRSVVLVDRYPTVEFVSAGTNGTGLMASIIKDRSGKQVPVGAAPPAEYANVRVGPYQQVVVGVGASNGLAVICNADDVRTMVIHALIRYQYRKERK